MVIELFEGVGLRFDRIPILFGSIPFVIMTFGAILSYIKNNRKAYKLSTIIGLLTSALIFVVGFTAPRDSVIFSYLIEIFWSMYVCLVMIFGSVGFISSKGRKRALITDLFFIIVMWIILVIVISCISYSTSRRTAIIDENKTNIYYLNMDRSNNSLEESLKIEDGQAIEVRLIEGDGDSYIEENIVYHYSENRSKEPAERSLLSTDKSYVVYINPDNFYLEVGS